MKKLYALLVLVLTVVTGNAQIVNIPDANFKAKLLAAAPNNNTASTETPFITANSSTVISYQKIDTNNDGEIQVSEAAAIKYLKVLSSSISDLTGIEAFVNLRYLNVGYNNLSTINLSNLNLIKDLDCNNNQLGSLNTSNLTSLQLLRAYHNQITTLDLSQNTLLTYAYVEQNLIASVNLSNNNALTELSITNNLIETLDLSNTHINYLYACCNPYLVTLNLKNNLSTSYIGLSGDTSLQYICADEFEIGSVANSLIPANLSNVNINSYCSFVPGGTFYTIQGTTRFDLNNNGCDVADIMVPNQKFNFTSGSLNGSLIANSTGAYSYAVQQGSHTITPVAETPSYFNSSPATATVSFPSATSPYAQNFCVTANGVKNDVEIIVLPITNARPGFDSGYKIVYKNKGNQVSNGSLSFSFDTAIMDLVSATPTNTSSSASSLTWNYTGLNPFEIRTITVQFHLNSPTETPAVNAGDELNYTATIVGPTDETPNDNTFALKQIVVNALDPNDKTCLEGTTITPSMVGQYVHYIIRFENTGTFAAENIVVADVIDATKFDLASLIPQGGSHSFVTRINNATNKVEFIFENINLPFDDANNDGYVAFKIKTKPTLVVGDTFSNCANIYFDYNFPIVTNTFTTTIQTLATQDFDFATYFNVYPNPTNGNLTIETKSAIGVKSMAVYNLLGQIVIAIPNAENVTSVDVSNLETGTYFLKVNTDKGSVNTKFIKH